MVVAASLAGRSAWVTGGATGIGEAVAVALARAGANIALGSLTDDRDFTRSVYSATSSLDEIKSIADDIRALGVSAMADRLDVRDQASVDGFYAAATTAIGSIDILINAAGVSAQETMIGHTLETWTQVIDINLNGPYRTIKRCWPAMLDSGFGRIVNIASTAAEVGFSGYSAYCASKAGLLGLTRCVALEGAEHGVSCNAINPGSVGTEMMRKGSLRRLAQGGQGATVEENFHRVAQSLPQKRLITPEEIAATAVYLCGEDAFGITGQAITVAGGALW